MFPGINQKQMKQMMRQLGINPIEIPSTEVIIKTNDKEIVIQSPQVSKINMMGQETWQVIGKAVERAKLEISEEDINTVAEQANVSRGEALQAIAKHNGDLAAAILEFKGSDN